MKLQAASKKEVKRIAIGTCVCDVIMIAGLFLLSQFGIGTFDYRVFVGAVGGSVVAILNFTLMCLTIQKAVDTADQKQMKAKFQLSYNGRMALQAVWVIIAFVVSHINVVAGALPLLFPNAVIFFLQSRGKLVEPSQRKNPETTDEDEPEDHLGSFEV